VNHIIEHETGAGGVPVSMLTHARGDRESLSWALFAAPFLPGDAHHCGRRTSRRVSHVLDLPHNDVLAAERFGPGPIPALVPPRLLAHMHYRWAAIRARHSRRRFAAGWVDRSTTSLGLPLDPPSAVSALLTSFWHPAPLRVTFALPQAIPSFAALWRICRYPWLFVPTRFPVSMV
jgi:hypothetical protein